MTSTALDRTELLTELHAGMRTRKTPQAVAYILERLGVDQALSADSRRALHDLASWQPYISRSQLMPETFRHHPGLHRAYQSASALVGQVTRTAGIPTPDEANPTDPSSLEVWLRAAHQILGLDPATARPARATTTNRQRAVSDTYPALGFDDVLSSMYAGEPIPLEELDFGEKILIEDIDFGDIFSPATPEPAGDASEQGPAAGDDHDAPTKTYSYTYQRRPRGRRGDTGGHSDARVRYTAATRRDKLPGVSVRTYRKAVRAVLHLAQRTDVLAGERDREAAIAYGKTRLAYTVPLEDFTASEATAAFVAYYTARLGTRTLFTSGAQARPMDTLAEELLTRALAAPDCRHDVIARVLTRRQVLQHLDDQAKGQLFGLTHAHLVAAARTLRGAWDPNRRDMIVRLGDDSSSWNAASRAFNQARTGLMNLAGELGLNLMLEQSCPGKVPALIAADVARWHEMEGGSREHADTAVFNELPKPWDVVLDGAPCPIELVGEVCTRHGLDADTSGWTAAYRQTTLEAPAPAPALVHGCIVASPELARQMRRAGWFSGQV